jgi:hypothetical protein
MDPLPHQKSDWEHLNEVLMKPGFGIVGVLDLLQTGAVSGAASIAGGFAGAVALGLSGGDVDYAVKRMDEWTEFLSMWAKDGPLTEDAKKMIEPAVPYLSRADKAITDYAEKKALGNPLAATIIKSGIWGLGEILTLGTGAGGQLSKIANIRKIRRQVEADAERLGIRLEEKDFHNDLEKAAREVGSSERGGAAEEYTMALREAEDAAKARKNEAYDIAFQKDAYMETSVMRQVKRDLLDPQDNTSLVWQYGPEGLAEMKHVQWALKQMDSGTFSSDNIATNLRYVERFRQRLGKRIKGADGSEKTALHQIKRALDDRLNEEFNTSMVADGRSALSGEPGALDAYREARKLNQEWQWFHDTKVIADLIKRETAPEQMSAWLIGVGVAGGRKEAGAIIQKIKKLLGDDHPAIDAIRQDFVYELMSPLLKRKPSYEQFLNNYDVMIRNNHSVVSALGLTDSDAAILKNFAEVAAKFPRGGKFYSKAEVMQAVAQFSVGHGIAKGAARIKLVTKLMKWMTGGEDILTKKEFLRTIGNEYMDVPIIPKDSPVAASVLAAGALADLEGIE